MNLAEIKNGVVVNTITVDPDDIPDWASGWPEVTGEVGIEDTFDTATKTFTKRVPPVRKVTPEDVFSEMDRRLKLGTTVNVTGVGPISVKGDDISIRNLQSLALGASIRINSGQGAVKSKFRDATGVVNQLTQNQIVELWSGGAAYGELMYDRAWALIADPANIPADYTEDSYWQ